jgi:hypothetical protein
MEVGVLFCEHVCFHVSEGSFRLVFDAVVEGLEDILFEVGCTWERVHHRVAVGVNKAGVVDSQHIHFDPGRYQGNDRSEALMPHYGQILLKPLDPPEFTTFCNLLRRCDIAQNL